MGNTSNVGTRFLSKAEIIRRLGAAPETFTFRAQCYDCGEGNFRQCALTQQPTRFCFTLKPKSGKGRVTVGPASFHILKKYAPSLYNALERGRLYLSVMSDATQEDQQQYALKKRVTDTSKKLSRLRHEARQRINAWKVSNRGKLLPEYLEAIKILIQRPLPEAITAEENILGAENLIVELEQKLSGTTATGDVAVPKPVPVPLQTRPQAVKPQPKPLTLTEELEQASEELSRAFPPVPEIEF